MRGFTLLETIITTAVLVTGLAAAAAAFSYTAGTNVTTQQRTAATVLLYEKMEEFKSVREWNPGGGLNPDSPTEGYFNSTNLLGTTYLRLWQVTNTVPRSLTVVVYSQSSGLTRRRMELIRATTTMTRTF